MKTLNRSWASLLKAQKIGILRNKRLRLKEQGRQAAPQVRQKKREEQRKTSAQDTSGRDRDDGETPDCRNPYQVNSECLAALFKPAPTLRVRNVKIVISLRRVLKHLAAGSCAAAQQTKANTEQLGTFLSNNKLISQTPGERCFSSSRL